MIEVSGEDPDRKTKDVMNETMNRMKAAFALVDPSNGPKARTARSWKDPINAYVMLTSLAAANVTIEEVKEAVVFYTATEATVTELKYGPFAGYGVTAKGYRAGPAGDH